MKHAGRWFWALFLVAVHAHAQAPPPEEAPDAMTAEARRRFDEGRRATAEGDFERARVAYMQTYLLNQSPVVLRNLGVAEIKSQHLAVGARHLASYLRGEPAPTETPEQRAAAERTLTEAEAKLGRLSIQVDVAGAEIVIDGELAGRSPLPFDWYVDPGKRTITVRKGERERTHEVQAAAGQVVRVDMTLPRAVPPSAVPPAAPGEHSNPAKNDAAARNASRSLPLIFMIGAGTATIASGVVWYVAADSVASANRDVDRLLAQAQSTFGDAPCARPEANSTRVCANLRARHEDGQSATTLKNYSRAATGIFALGTVAAAAYWWASRPSDSAEDGQNFHVDIWVGPQVSGFSAGGMF